MRAFFMARTEGIGDAREDGADSAETRLSCEQILISAAIEGRGTQDMVALVLSKSRPDSRIEPHTGEKGGGHVEQHEEQRNREG